MTPSQPIPVDLVYAWVDGDDPGLAEDLDRFATTPNERNPERTRDPYDFLRYSLRSVERFVPWIRNVHIVTRRPQVPAWLDTDNPRVHVVHHDELDGFQPYLPTFNSAVIESFIGEVPGLTEHFLYMNDDFLFGAPCTLEDFLTPDGKYLIYGTHFGIWLPFRIYRSRFKFFKTVHLEHHPWFVYKPFWREMLTAHADKLHRSRKSRFRRGSNVRMDRLYRMWMLGPRRKHAQAVRGREFLRFHRFHQIENDVEVQRRALDDLAAMKPKFYCLNDDQGPNPDPEVSALVRSFLDAYYPEPSTFERADV